MKTVFAALVLLASPLAMAQDNTDNPQIVIPDVTEVDFQEVDVNASLTGPSMVMVQERAGAKFTPFVTLRAHFTPEMRQSTRQF